MVAPVFGKEGARVSAGDTWIAVSARTDSNGAVLGIEVSCDSAFATILHSSSDGHADSSAGAITSSSLYISCAYVGGLTPDTEYYWRVYAEDSSGNRTTPQGELFSGKIRTLTNDSIKRYSPFRLVMVGCQMGELSGLSKNAAIGASYIYDNVDKLAPNALLFLGDLVYPDEMTKTPGLVRGTDPNITPFVDNSWYIISKQTNGDLNDGSKERYATNLRTTWDGNLYQGGFKSLAHLTAKYSMWSMWDDHDWGTNDSAKYSVMSANSKLKIQYAYEIGGWWFHSLNKYRIKNDTYRGIQRVPPNFSDVASLSTTLPETYWKQDIFTGPGTGARFVVLDCRSQRDLSSDPDSASKYMISPDQEAWFYEQVDTLPDNWFFVWCDPLQGDGNHGWRGPGVGWNDNWKGYSYQFQRMMQYIRSAGIAHRTLRIASDTHAGMVIDYHDDGSGGTLPIQEWCAAGFMNPSSMLSDGWSGKKGQPDITDGVVRAAVGYGGVPQAQWSFHHNCLTVDVAPREMKVAYWELHPRRVDTIFGSGKLTKRTLGPRMLAERIYRI